VGGGEVVKAHMFELQDAEKSVEDFRLELEKQNASGS
jgi:hypothetical protein